MKYIGLFDEKEDIVTKEKLETKQDIITGAATTITDDNLIASRTLVSDASGKVVVSPVTSTELGYLDGVTSNIQTQLDKKLEEIPIATSAKIGGVMPVSKTNEMTQSVGVSEDGKLWTLAKDGLNSIKATITYDSSTKTYSSDKTFNELSQAYSNDDYVYCVFGTLIYDLYYHSSKAMIFCGNNTSASNTQWYTAAIKISNDDTITSWGVPLLSENSEIDLNSSISPAVGALPGICWYLRPSSNDASKYYLYSHKIGDSLIVINTWADVLQYPDNYNLCIYYNNRIYQKGYFNSVATSTSPLSGKFIDVDYIDNKFVCRILSVDAFAFIMQGESDTVVFSEEITDVGGEYVLPIASTTQLGGVKVGAGLSVTENGVLSATGGGTADAVEWNNVLDKPTTIAGYGITDAKIENGTITLGDKTITPLTSAPVTSVNSKTGDVTVREVPSVTASDNGKFLRVVNGAWAAADISDANGVSF